VAAADSEAPLAGDAGEREDAKNDAPGLTLTKSERLTAALDAELVANA
jgi:hypothetical protein